MQRMVFRYRRLMVQHINELTISYQQRENSLRFFQATKNDVLNIAMVCCIQARRLRSSLLRLEMLIELRELEVMYTLCCVAFN